MALDCGSTCQGHCAEESGSISRTNLGGKFVAGIQTSSQGAKLPNPNQFPTLSSCLRAAPVRGDGAEAEILGFNTEQTRFFGIAGTKAGREEKRLGQSQAL